MAFGLALLLSGTALGAERAYGARTVQTPTAAIDGSSARRHGPPKLVLWAWSRSDDLGFLAHSPWSDGSVPDVAFLSGEILVGPSGMQVRPRLRRLRLPHVRAEGARNIERTAVVYIEIARQFRSPLGPRGIARLVQRIRALPLVRDAPRLQLNFEAMDSRRADWYALVAALRLQIPTTQRLDVTALADWCMHAGFAPRGVDRVVPMLYSLGPVSPALGRVLDGTDAFPAAACRASIGVTADALLVAPHRLIARADRLYVFAPGAWTPERYDRLMQSLRQIGTAASGASTAF